MMSIIFLPRFAIACSNSEFTPWSAVCHFAFYVLIWFLVEDFLWFVLNPYFTIQKYKKEYISWHKTWIVGIPLHNVLGIVTLCVLAVCDATPNLWISMFISTVLCILVTMAAPMYHKFYNKLHLRSHVIN